jgi:trk system potassium uptake protein TrkH
MQIRPVLYIIGIFLTMLSASMVIPALVDIYDGSEDWRTFLFSALCTSFTGMLLILTNKSDFTHLDGRQAFLLTTFSWVFIAFFSALPFWLSEMKMSFTDSFFEAMSGVTTTGSTVIDNLNETPRGILIWRALLQWLGGIGIIVMAISIMPMLRVGGMQLFRMESSEKEKALPRATKMASSIGYIYLFLTFLCVIAYHAFGMDTFDAVAHAMTTIATGGFSTYDTSFSHYHEPHLEYTAVFFMWLGCLPFVLYLKAMNGNWRSLFEDKQVRWFFGIVLGAAIIMTLYLTHHSMLPFWEAFRRALFNTTSVITGTGYANYDYMLWGNFAVGMIFFLSCIGGCAGSTTCGIKVFRFQVLYEISTVQIKQLISPNGVFIPRFNGKPMPKDVPMSVMSFFFMFALCFVVLALTLSLLGLDYLTAMSGAVTSISNVGPGLGHIIGPTGTFKLLPDSAKWVLSFGMILGRLELFTILVMLAPNFWRK